MNSVIDRSGKWKGIQGGLDLLQMVCLKGPVFINRERGFCLRKVWKRALRELGLKQRYYSQQGSVLE